eukprot:761575-Hanusia_phi.AAC.4
MHSLLAPLVVNLTLLRVRENFVGLADGLAGGEREGREERGGDLELELCLGIVGILLVSSGGYCHAREEAEEGREQRKGGARRRAGRVTGGAKEVRMARAKSSQKARDKGRTGQNATRSGEREEGRGE